jgi:hypothetical protein
MIMKDLYINDIVRWVGIMAKIGRGLWSGLVDRIKGL